MTKAYLNFNHLPRIQSRRFIASSVGHTSEYKTGDKPAEDEPEDKRKEDELMVTIQTRIDKALEGLATPEQLQQIRNEQAESLRGVSIESLRAMADDKTGVMAKLAQQGLKIQQLEVQASQRSNNTDMSLKGQIRAWMDSKPKSHGGKSTVRDIVKEIRGGTQILPPPIELELRVAASPMTPATVNAGASGYIGSYEVESGYNDFIRAEPTFWDWLTKGRTSYENIIWINKTNPQGAAAFLAPGQLKPGVSFELEAENSHAKKIADSAKAATELLEDIDGMETMIRDELRYQVFIKLNSTLIGAGAGSSTDPAGIRNYAVGYTETGIHVNAGGNATFVDAIRAVVGQLRSGLLTGPIDLFINPIDSANMDIAKAVDSGVYLLPPFVTANGRQVAGAQIHEDAGVPVGYILGGFMRFYRILIYKPFRVAWGWENDDFTRNLITAIGEMRFHQYVNSIHTGAFIYDSFENVMTAIAPTA